MEKGVVHKNGTATIIMPFIADQDMAPFLDTVIRLALDFILVSSDFTN